MQASSIEDKSILHNFTLYLHMLPYCKWNIYKFLRSGVQQYYIWTGAFTKKFNNSCSDHDYNEGCCSWKILYPGTLDLRSCTNHSHEILSWYCEIDQMKRLIFSMKTDDQ